MSSSKLMFNSVSKSLTKRTLNHPFNQIHSKLIRQFSAQTATEKKNEASQTKKDKKMPETNSFVMNMFSGIVKPDQVFPYPQVLTDDQHEVLSMIKEPNQKLFASVDPLKYDLQEKMDDNVLQQLKDLGGFGIQVPVEYGGAGLCNTQYARLGEIMGSVDLAIGIVLGAHQSIGFKGLLLYGNDEQKKRYLPDLAVGNKIAAYCLTEPGSGSDAASIKTRAEISPDGKHYILNGSKIWISNGGIADFFTVFAKTTVKNSKGEDVDKVTAFMVERSFGGVTNGPPEKKMGIKASNTAEVYFENVKVPVENILGEVGDGFKVAMNILNSGRFGMSAALSGSMRSSIAKAVNHATTRLQFGNKIATYGTIQEKIARMSMAHYITESLAYMVSGNMDRGHLDFQLEAAISKIFGSEAAWFVTDECIQILGGMGYMRDAGAEKVLRDARIFRIFEGTNEILRLFIALTGLQTAGGHLKELQRAMRNPVANMGMIFDQGTKRVFRAVGISSAPSITEFVDPKLRDSAVAISKSMENFGASVEHLLIKYNKNIIHEQFLLNRLANSAIDIYTSLVVLSRATRSLKQNLSSATHEKNMVEIICNEANERVLYNLGSLRSSDKLKHFDTMKKIAETVYEAEGVAQVHPIDR